MSVQWRTAKKKLKTWVSATFPRSTREIGAWIEREFGLAYAGRSGLIALLHHLGLTYRKPEIISRELNVKTQKLQVRAVLPGFDLAPCVRGAGEATHKTSTSFVAWALARLHAQSFYACYPAVLKGVTQAK